MDFAQGTGSFASPVEVDETCFGGKEKKKPASWKLKTGRGPTGTTAVVGVEDHETKEVMAKVLKPTDKDTLQGFAEDTVAEGAKAHNDDKAYKDLKFDHDRGEHSLSEYVKSDLHTNGIE